MCVAAKLAHGDFSDHTPRGKGLPLLIGQQSLIEPQLGVGPREHLPMLELSLWSCAGKHSSRELNRAATSRPKEGISQHSPSSRSNVLPQMFPTHYIQ